MGKSHPLLNGSPLNEIEVSAEYIGPWPVAECFSAEASGAMITVVRCAKTGKQAAKEAKPFASSDPRPRRLTRDTIQFTDETTAKVAAERINGRIRDAFPPRRLLCIINPRSGSLTGEHQFASKVRPVLEAAGAVLDVRVTTAQGDATKWAYELPLGAVPLRDEGSAPYDGVTVCGGDGTLNEVLEGLATRPDAKRAIVELPLCHLGGGTSNAIACNVAMESDEAHVSCWRPVPLPFLSLHRAAPRCTVLFSPQLCVRGPVRKGHDLGSIPRRAGHSVPSRRRASGMKQDPTQAVTSSFRLHLSPAAVPLC